MYRVSSTFQRRIALLRWTLPLLLGFLTVFYEVGPGRLIHDRSVSTYFDIDIIFYALFMPLFTFGALTVFSHWLGEKEKIEQHARDSDRHLASIMTASADAIISVDSKGCIESWNLGAELLFGNSAEKIQGQPLSVLFGSGESADVEFQWLTQTVRQKGFIRAHETTCVTADGRRMAVELTGTRLTDEEGLFYGISVILRDITERKHREAEIRRLNADLNGQVAERTRELAQKVEELARANIQLQALDQTRSEFVSLVSHQIRAPLTNIQGAVERMEGDCRTPNITCNRMLVIVEQQTARLNRLVSDILNATRIEAGEMALQREPISILPVVQQVVDQTRARAVDRLFQTPTKPGLPLVFADRDRVAEVLANLLDNADKYSSPGKAVVIDMRADQTEVTVSVQDFGSGLRPQDMDRVFEKFYRADGSDSQPSYGYGLGLYVCRQLILAQGGRIWAENAPTGGAVFSFTLPVWR